MKVIEQNAVLLDTTGMTPYQIIERVGRTCYKSEENITEDSAPKFVARLYRDGHHAMLEFGYVYVKITDLDLLNFIIDTSETSYLRYIENYVVGSLRAFYDWLKYLFNASQKYESTHDFVEECKTELLDFIWGLSELYPEIFHAMYDEFCAEFDENHHYSDHDIKAEDVTNPFKFMSREEFIKSMKNDCVEDCCLSHMLPHVMLFTTDRGITHELVRHRPCSFAMESTRYCNYGKDKFGGELTIIAPCFANTGDAGSIRARNLIWELGMEEAEKNYLRLLQFGATPEQARDALPHAVKADLWMCATEDEWQHIINLRYHENTGKAHPKMTALMEIAYPQLYKASEGRIR